MTPVQILRICAVLLLILNHCVNGYRKAKNTQQYCRLKSGRVGVCCNFDSCDLNLLNTEQEPALCSSNGDDLKVCCPLKTPPPIPILAAMKTAGTTTNVKTSVKSTQRSKKREKQNVVLTKSSQKCLEYSKIKCSTPQITRTIVRGEKVKTVEHYPHMALLGYSDPENPDYDNLSWQCGGTLISENFILTAAHCLQGTNQTAPVVAHLGFVNKNNRNQYGTLQQFKIVERIKHPDRKDPSTYADIALLKLDKPAVFSKSVLPACLYEQSSFSSKTAQATGWGDTASEDYKGSDDLMKVTLAIQSHENCSAFYPSNRKMKQGIKGDQQFCAGNDGKDTCQGDSGGPLQIIGNDYCMHNIIGVTSFGNSCGLQPGVYTRVSYYVPWIESIVWP